MDSNNGTALLRHSIQKVQSIHSRRRHRTVMHPVIRLSGIYLERYGFNIDDEVEVTCVPGKIEIKKIISDSVA